MKSLILIAFLAITAIHCYEYSEYRGKCYGCLQAGYEYCNGYPDEDYNIIDGKCYDSISSDCLRPAKDYMQCTYWDTSCLDSNIIITKYMVEASKTKTYKISGDTRCMFYIKNESGIKGVVKFE